MRNRPAVVKGDVPLDDLDTQNPMPGVAVICNPAPGEGGVKGATPLFL